MDLIVYSGDYQFDVYRMMRKHSGGAWENYHPLTNVMVSVISLLAIHISSSHVLSGYTTL